MGLGDWFKERQADLNVFDNGRTAKTVRNERQAKVAQTVRQKQIDDENYRLNQQKAMQRLNQQRQSNTVPVNNIQGGNTVLRPDVAQKMAYDQRVKQITGADEPNPYTQLPNGVMVSKQKTGLGETFLNNAASGIMNIAPQRIAGGIAEYGGTVLGNDKIRDWGTRQSQPFRDFNTVAYEEAGNKTAAVGSQIAGNLLTLPLAPQARVPAMATRAVTAFAPRAADTANAIRESGGSRGAQIAGGGAVGTVSAVLNTVGGEKLLRPFSSKVATNATSGLGKVVTTKLVNSAGGRIATAGITEGTENVVDQGVDNFVAQKTYDPNRKLTTNLVSSGLMGAAMGSAVRGGVEVGNSPKAKSAIKSAATGMSEATRQKRADLANAYTIAKDKGDTGRMAYFAREIDKIDSANQAGFIGRDAPQVGKTPVTKDVQIAQANEQTLLQDYKNRFKTNILNTDDVREVFDKYGYNRKNSADYHEGASYLSNKMFDEQVNTLKPNDKYLFMAGSSGAGKSLAVRAFPEVTQNIKAGLDGNFSSESAVKKLDRVIKTGAKPTIAFVDRDPVAAWNDGVMKRAKDPANGRVVPAEVFIDNYFGSRDTVVKAAKKYGNKVEVRAYQNGNEGVLPISDPIAYLSKKGYNKSDVKEQVLQSIKNAEASGEIDSATAKSLAGRYYTEKPKADAGISKRQKQQATSVVTLQDALDGKSTRPTNTDVNSQQGKLKVQDLPKQVLDTPLTDQTTQTVGTVSDGQNTNPSALKVQKQQTWEVSPQQSNRTQTELETVQTSALSGNNTTKQGKSQLNTDRLNLNKEQKAQLAKETQETISKLSNKEIQSLAKDAGIDTKTHTPEQIKKKIAEQLNVRQDAVSYMRQAEEARLAGDTELAASLLAKSAEQGRVSRAQGTELAQQLQARRIIANTLDTPQQRIFKLLDSAGVNPEVYTKRLAEVDFNDSKQVIEAYRDMVPATKMNWIDTVRYNSMLSSPLTHMVNTFSNAVNVGTVAPLEKTIRGIADATGGLFGKERKYAAGEGVAYMSGAAKNLKKAAGEFLDVMRNVDHTQNLDLQDYNTPLAVKGAAGKAYSVLSVPMKLLGASDKFFRTLASAGEENSLNLRQSKGIKVNGNIKELADAEGAYRLYQQDTGIKGQGKILENIDGVTDAIMQLRSKHPVFKWVFPFVKTPTNILKQGVEFSPLGFANAATARDKSTAFTRAAIGTAVFGAAAAMIAAGDVTWSEPKNQDEKNRFRSEGKQPYAIRVGGKWVGFNKLPPAYSFPLALTAAINDAVETGKMTDSTGSKIFEGIAKYGEFLSDQSYLKNIGDTLAAFKGDAEKSVQAVSNYPQQMIPFRALSGWVARMSDNTERKIDTSKGEINKQVQSLMQQIPGLRQKTPTRDYEGQPIPANNPVLNSFSPLKVTDDKGTSQLDQVRDVYKEQQKVKSDFKKQLTDAQKNEMSKMTPAQQDAYKANLNRGIVKDNGQISDKYKTDAKGNIYVQIGDEIKTFTSKDKADKAVFENDFANGDKKTAEFGGKMYFKDDTTERGFRTQSKSDYNFDKSMSGVAIELDKAKAANNLDAYNKVADKKYNALQKKLEGLDPETDFKEIDSVNKQLLDLQQEYEKYNEQGYIRKSKSGGKGSKLDATKMFGYGSPASSTNKSLRSLLESLT